MKLSIVIVNWNSKDQTRDCLDSLRAHCSNLKLQIIVVDGGSFDGCDQMIANDYPEVEFTQSEKNIGFGKSNNLGAEKATGEALLLLNPDTEVEPNSLQTLLAELEKQPQAGILGPLLLNSDSTRQEGSVHAFPTPLNQALDSDYLKRRLPKSSLWKTYKAFKTDSTTEVDAVGGACMLMWRSTFESVGGFTLDYFMYAEDLDLCKKVSVAGFRNYHAPQARVFHHAGCSSEKQFSKFSAVLIPTSMSIYMRLNHGLNAAIIYRVFICLSASFRTLAIGSVYALSSQSKRSRLIASLKRWTAVLSWSFGGQRWIKEYT